MTETPRTDLEDKVLTFQVGSCMYGLPLAWVCAVEAAGRRDEEGTCEFRGERLPFVDLDDFFASGSSSGGSLLILGKGRPETATLVENPGVVGSAGEVYKLPELCQSFVEDTFSGVMVTDDRIILMVDPERLCREGGGRRSGSVGEATGNDQDSAGR